MSPSARWRDVLALARAELERFGGSEPRPLVAAPDEEPERSWEELGRVEPAFRRTIRVEVPEAAAPALHAARAAGLLRSAWPARRLGARVRIAGGATPPGEFIPRFLRNKAEGGIGLPELRRAPDGLHGGGARIGVVERGWLRDHPDLPRIEEIRPGPNREPEHGTQTLGVLGMKPNRAGATGLAHRAALGVAAPYASPATSEITEASIADAIFAAARWARRGDGHGVLLVEEASGDRTPDLPVELYWACHAAIRHATQRGVTVVEPAGNAPLDLDREPRLNPRRRAFVDSGAIVVGAVQFLDGRWTTTDSTHGARIDVHGDGWGVYTTLADGRWDGGYSGTSAASAVVAGVVAILASVAHTRRLPWSPARARALLRRHQQPGGVPDLPALLDALGAP